MTANDKRKRPADLTTDRLRELYWGQDLTLDGVAARYQDSFSGDAVRLWLVADGIPRRKTQTAARVCIIEGCDEPAHKSFNGRHWGGRLCAAHERERDRRRQAYLDDSRREQSGAALALEISKLLTGLPESVKSDAESELMLAALSGVLALPITHESAKAYIAAAFRENADAYKFLSIQAPASSDEGAQTWGDRLGLS